MLRAVQVRCIEGHESEQYLGDDEHAEPCDVIVGKAPMRCAAPAERLSPFERGNAANVKPWRGVAKKDRFV